jgi:hypothetical protein
MRRFALTALTALTGAALLTQLPNLFSQETVKEGFEVELATEYPQDNFFEMPKDGISEVEVVLVGITTDEENYSDCKYASDPAKCEEEKNSEHL